VLLDRVSFPVIARDCEGERLAVAGCANIREAKLHYKVEDVVLKGSCQSETKAEADDGLCFDGVWLAFYPCQPEEVPMIRGAIKSLFPVPIICPSCRKSCQFLCSSLCWRFGF